MAKVEAELVATKPPDYGLVLKVLGHSVLILLVILSMPLFGLIWGGSSHSEPDSTNFELLPLLFRDLINEELLRVGDKSLLMSGAADQGASESLVVRENKMDLISVSDFERQSSVPEATFDLAFVNDFGGAAGFIDRTLKIGGIAVVQLSNDASVAFDRPSNYRIVYLRRFDSTVVAMRKTDNNETKSRTLTRLLALSSEAKKKGGAPRTTESGVNEVEQLPEADQVPAGLKPATPSRATRGGFSSTWARRRQTTTTGDA